MATNSSGALGVNSFISFVFFLNVTLARACGAILSNCVV